MLIVLSGKARVGKDTVAAMIRDLIYDECKEHFTLIAYADRLKTFIGEYFNLTDEHLYGKLKIEPLLDLEKSDGTYWTTRELLQYFGTDVFRAVKNDYWVSYVKNIIIRFPGNYIITDARFPNEVEWVVSLDGLHIAIEGNSREDVGNAQHASEKSLDDYETDCIVFKNDVDTLNALQSKIKEQLLPIILSKLNEGEYDGQTKTI
jgi:hypothetical protein